MPFPRDKYVVIAINNLDAFDRNSAKTLWLSKSGGIQEVMATKGDKSSYTTVAYVFPASNYTVTEAREWIRDKFGSNALSRNELLASKRVRIASSAILCKTQPNLITKAPPQAFAKEEADAMLNDKYYLFANGVHSGENLNGDFFSKNELTENYKSASFQPFDWEHNRDEIIGTSLEAELNTTDGDELALGVSAILNRLSPYMQREERVDDKLISRDDLVKQRYFEGKLAVSMECAFDRMRCTECGFESDDFIEFDFHVIMNHSNILESGGRIGRELVGVDFTGWGVVEHPADTKAFVTSLRTSDDGTIQDIVSASTKQYGKLAAGIDFAQTIVSLSSYDDTFYSDDYSQFSFASERKTTPKKSTELVNSKENETINGGQFIMFNLKAKIEGCKTLSQIFAKAQVVLSDFQGDKPLSGDATKAFTDELTEVVASIIKAEDFRVTEIFEVTTAEKLEAVSTARSEEAEKATTISTDLNSKIETLTASNTDLTSKLDTANQTIADLNKEKAEADTKDKVDAYMDELSEAGVKFEGKILSESIKTTVRAKIDDKEALANLKKELVAQVKIEVLGNASQQPTGAGAGSSDNSGFAAKLEAARKNEK